MKFFDGFTNLLKSFGSKNDTRTQTKYNYTQRITKLHILLDDMYATKWLAAKIVDIPVEDAFREGRTFENLEDEQLKEVKKTYKKIDKKISLALKYARIFGGAALILVSDDDSLDQPLTQLQQGDLQNIAVVDASQMTPQNIDRNPLSPNYMKPSSYLINNVSQQIHPSRVIYIDGITTTNREREKNQGFGNSIFERVYKNIEDAIQTTVAIRNLVEQSNLDIVAMKGLNSAVASSAEDVVKERISILSEMKSILNTIAIDSEDTYTNIAKNFSTLDKIQLNMFQIVAGAADIPYTRLMGKSADGMNATGDGDIKNYYDSVKADIQIDILEPIYAIIDPIINMHLFGNLDPFKYEFNPLYQMTPLEQAELENKRANTDNIYINAGVITPEGVLNDRQKNGLYVDYNPDDVINYELPNEEE